MTWIFSFFKKALCTIKVVLPGRESGTLTHTLACRGHSDIRKLQNAGQCVKRSDLRQSLVQAARAFTAYFLKFISADKARASTQRRINVAEKFTALFRQFSLIETPATRRSIAGLKRK